MSPMRDRSVSLEQVRPGDGGLGSSSPVGRNLSSGSGEQPILRLDLLRSLQLHRRLALGIFAAGLLLAVAYFLLRWPVYTAQSLVYVQPAPAKVLEQGAAARWPYDANSYESYIQQQLLSVTRYDVLAGALKKLQSAGWQKSGESEQAAVERLKHAIEVKRVGSSYQISITASASTAAMAAEESNAVAASFIESASREDKAGEGQRLAMLGEERDRIQKELTADRTEQEALNKQLGMAAIGTAAPDVYDDDIGRIRQELVKARGDHADAAARLIAMGAEHAPSSAALNAEADEIVAADPGLVSMKTSLNQRRAILITQMANLTPNHSLYKQDAAELAQIDASLDSMMKDLRAKAAARIQQRLRTDLQRTAGVEAQLNAQLGQLAGAAGNATYKLQRSNDLATDILRLQNRYTVVDEQWRNLTLDNGAPGAEFLSAPAVVPLHPASFSVLRNTLLIVFVGLFLGLLAAVIAHKLDPKVYIAADVEQVLGFAPLAVLPDFDETTESVAEEHLLRLSAAIEYARKQGNLKSCIFTGTGTGTGVTTVATRVRAMLETMGRPTVLVDASGTPRPARASAGSGAREVSSQLTTQRGSRPTALLQQMTEETETQEESLVLTDTAPLTISAETEYLARFVDCAIVVIESGVTTRAQLEEAASTLERVGVSAVGFVLNRVGLQKADASFRRSVQDMETHLHSQNRSFARRTVRSGPFGAETSPVAGSCPEELSVHTRAEAEKPKPVAAALSASPVSPELLAVLAEPERPAAHEPERKSAQETEAGEIKEAEVRVRPARQLAEPVPWWLADLLPAVSGPGIAQPAQAEAKQAEPRQAEPKSAEELFEPEVAAAPQHHPAEHGPAEQKAAEQKVAEQKAEPAAAPVAAPVAAPAQSWERVPPIFAEVKAEAKPEANVAEAGQAAGEAEEDAESAASRLSGLKNLLFVLGLKDLHKDEETRQPEAPAATERVKERPAYVHAYASVPDAGGRNRAARSSSALVTATPEFLPPGPKAEKAEKAEKENLWQNDSAGHRDRRDAYDEVQILPSWRGQYKKK